MRRMRLLRIVGGAFLTGALAGMLVAASAGATKPTSSEALRYRSGTIVAFRDTSLQCLVFGPLSGVKGKNGVLCFKGRPRRRAGGTRWVMTTPRSITSSTSSSDATYRAITSSTPIRASVALSQGSTFTLAGVRYTSNGRTAELGCRYQVVRVVDPGQKAVICTDVDGGTPVPGSFGFVLSQRVLAMVEFRSDGQLTIETTWRLPPCSCDK
jgi:hypothetical protein